MGVPNGTAATNGLSNTLTSKDQIPSHFIGGNRLDSAVPSVVKDFVAKHDGHSVINSVGLLRSELWKKKKEGKLLILFFFCLV